MKETLATRINPRILSKHEQYRLHSLVVEKDGKVVRLMFNVFRKLNRY